MKAAVRVVEALPGQPVPAPDAGVGSVIRIDRLFGVRGADAAADVVASRDFRRTRVDLPGGSQVLLDSFPEPDAPACCFLRLAPGDGRPVRLALTGVERIEPCPAGGWLLSGALPGAVSYWVPQPAAARTVDAHGRILTQSELAPTGVGADAEGLQVEYRVPVGSHLDLTAWRIPAGARTFAEALLRPLALERQGWFLRSSHATCGKAADVFACLVHGSVYDRGFVWRRIWKGYRWRICSENEAYSLYVTLHGLERATQRSVYSLLKRQLVYSALARQSDDCGWHHGEWTDLVESHFRLHNAGVQLLAAAFEERRDPVVGEALARAAAFSATRADRTDLGLWFLHDSLEESVEAATTKDAPPWDPAPMLGASKTNKLILNTHLDAIVTLDRVREVSGDRRHDEAIASARAAARAVLALRPAELRYRLAFRAVWATLVPPSIGARHSLARRAVRRLARDYLVPRLYRLRRAHPRFVLPGGLLDRHLVPRHFDLGYHPVNLMDLVRLWRRFSDEDFRAIVEGAVAAVTRSHLLQYWAETNHKQPIGYWVDALYRLATLDRAVVYRRYLAEAMLACDRAGLGLPPVVLGGDPEAVELDVQVPCPSPVDERLRVANLGRKGRREVLVVNPSDGEIELRWEAPLAGDLRWFGRDGEMGVASADLRVPARGWVLGRERTVEDEVGPKGAATP